jgi:hypothetical protein
MNSVNGKRWHADIYIGANHHWSKTFETRDEAVTTRDTELELCYASDEH